jgi:hypothetical protein
MRERERDEPKDVTRGGEWDGELVTAWAAAWDFA